MSGRRFEEAGLKGMMRVWSTGAVQRWEAPGLGDWGTGTVRGGKRPGPRKAPRLFGGDTSAAFAVMPGVVCGDSRQCSR